MDHFIYASLTKLTSMRLLKIIVNDDKLPLRCELCEIDLDTQDIPRYTALSYCWGDQTDVRDIICNDKRLTITATLESALRMTQPHNPSEFIWADQICICQSDADEKLQQLRVMTVIFQAAWTVIGWLGPEDPTTGLGLEQVRTVGTTYDYEQNKDEAIATGYALKRTPDLSTSTELYESMETDSIAWLAFSRFFDRPWFARVWVVQEMLPALQLNMTRQIDAILVCGTHIIEWWIVFSAAKWACIISPNDHERPVHQDMTIDGVQHTNRLRIEAFSRMSYIIEANPVRSIGRYSFEVMHLLRNFRNRQATDPRDKVYGLLGLSNFNVSESSTDRTDRSALITVAKIPVDYSLSVLETYRNFARAHIEHTVKSEKGGSDLWLPLHPPGRGLMILHDATPRSIEPGWPTWVPDWRREGHHGHLYFPNTNPSHACSATIDTILYTHPDPNCLEVGGVIVGRVTWVHEGNHASQVVSDSKPRAVGKFIASKIGPKYKHGSKKRNNDPNSYRMEADRQKEPEKATEFSSMEQKCHQDIRKLGGTNIRTKTFIPVNSNEDKHNSQEPVESETDTATDVEDDPDEQEDTETAFLWTLTLNELPPIFAEANFTRDEYADTQVLYDCFDVFRSKMSNQPMPDFTPSQFALNDRLTAVWKIGTSGNQIDKFFKSCLCDRRLFITDTGYIGIAHDDVRIGDEAALLFGANSMCILRPIVMENGEEAHELIGEAWIRGASHGEVVDEMYGNGEIVAGQPVGRAITLR